MNKHIVIFAAIFMISLQACVNDDSFFPNENNTVVSSIAIVTVLQNFGKEEGVIREENQCFKFIYPIVLGYNTDATIKVDSYVGLVEILNSQRANFNISGLQFPIQVIFEGSNTPITIEDEITFISILNDCQFNTLRQDFDTFNNRCFRLQYPLSVFDVEENEVILNSVEDFNEFLIDQGSIYQPRFKFPIVVFKEPNFDTDVEIQTYYGFYRILESCSSGCPDIEVSVQEENNLTLEYVFTATTSDPEIQFFSWFIDNEFVDNQGGDELLNRFDSPGKYKICVAIETPQCPKGKEKCIELEVATKCPELSFEWERLPESFEHRFIANFERRADMNYQWFIDGEPLEQDGGPNGDHMFSQVLEPDSREICIKASIPSCPGEELEYCEIILVEQRCPDLFFAAEQQGETNAYAFFADFPDIDKIQYSWFVDNIFVQDDGGPGANNSIVREFEPGNYEICIKAETPDCPSSTEFCEQITIL